MYRDITKTNKNVQRHYKDKLCTCLKDKHKCLTLQRQTKMYRKITKTNFVMSTKTNTVETLQRQTKMYRDITKTNTNEFTKTNKNVQRHYKYKHKFVCLQRQTQMCLSF